MCLAEAREVGMCQEPLQHVPRSMNSVGDASPKVEGSQRQIQKMLEDKNVPLYVKRLSMQLRICFFTKVEAMVY
jgi:hypothetical protein